MVGPTRIWINIGENYCRRLLPFESVNRVETQLTTFKQLIAQKIVLTGWA